MAFVDSFLPLPTQPSIQTTFTYDTQVLKNGVAAEQRFNRLTEWYSTHQLSDVTFTEDQLDTFVTYWRTTLGGKENTFRFTVPLERFAQSLALGFRGLDSHIANNGTVYTYGALVAVDANDQVVDVTSGPFTRWQLVKVYEIDWEGLFYNNIKTIRKPRINTVRVWNPGGTEILNGVDFTVDTDTGIVTTTLAYDPGTFLDAQFEFDIEARIDMDEVPQIILSRGKFTDIPTNNVSTCDYYQFSNLTVIEVPDHKLNKSALLANWFSVEAYYESPTGFDFQLDYRPTESIAHKYQVRLEQTFNKFQNADSYAFSGGDTQLNFEDTLLRNIPIENQYNLLTQDPPYYLVAEYVSAFYHVVMGKWRLFGVEHYYNPGQPGAAEYQFMRFDTDLSVQNLVDAGCELYQLDPLLIIGAQSAQKVIGAANTLTPRNLPAIPPISCPVDDGLTQTVIANFNTFSRTSTFDEPSTIALGTVGTFLETGTRDHWRQSSAIQPVLICYAGGSPPYPNQDTYYSYHDMNNGLYDSTILTPTNSFLRVLLFYSGNIDTDTYYMRNNRFLVTHVRGRFFDRIKIPSPGVIDVTHTELRNMLAPHSPSLTTTDPSDATRQTGSYYTRIMYNVDGELYYLVHPTPQNLIPVGGVNETITVPKTSQEYFIFSVDSSQADDLGNTLIETFTVDDVETKLGITLVQPTPAGYNLEFQFLTQGGTNRYYFLETGSFPNNDYFIYEGASFAASVLVESGTIASNRDVIEPVRRASQKFGFRYYLQPTDNSIGHKVVDVTNNYSTIGTFNLNYSAPFQEGYGHVEYNGSIFMTGSPTNRWYFAANSICSTDSIQMTLVFDDSSTTSVQPFYYLTYGNDKFYLMANAPDPTTAPADEVWQYAEVST